MIDNEKDLDRTLRRVLQLDTFPLIWWQYKDKDEDKEKDKEEDRALRRELQLETFPLDCRRQVALSKLHKGNTRLDKQRANWPKKREKKKKKQS